MDKWNNSMPQSQSAKSFLLTRRFAMQTFYNEMLSNDRARWLERYLQIPGPPRRNATLASGN
jgi:hypothetical protein